MKTKCYRSVDPEALRRALADRRLRRLRRMRRLLEAGGENCEAAVVLAFIFSIILALVICAMALERAS